MKPKYSEYPHSKLSDDQRDNKICLWTCSEIMFLKKSVPGMPTQ